jgi:hypothetical protein
MDDDDLLRIDVEVAQRLVLRELRHRHERPRPRERPGIEPELVRVAQQPEPLHNGRVVHGCDERPPRCEDRAGHVEEVEEIRALGAQ